MSGFVLGLPGKFLDEELKRSDRLKNLTRHYSKYVKPFEGKGGLRLAKDFKHAGGVVSSGTDENPTHVTPTGMKVIDGKVHVTTHIDGTEHHIPITHFYKAKELRNAKTAGFDLERQINDHLKRHGLVNPERNPAGSSAVDKDIVLDHPATNKEIHGKNVDKIDPSHNIVGEIKERVSKAKFGSAFVRYNHASQKWELPAETRAKKPRFAKEIDKATVTDDKGVTRSLMDHINHHWGKPEVGKKLTSVVSNTTDASPAHAYLHDSGAHFIHINDRGTFRAGQSEHNDHFGTELPVLKGTGRFTVSSERARTEKQEREGTRMQINFRMHPKSVEKSSVDIGTDEGAQTLKKSLEKNARK
jgi:hypothetical protein